MFIYRLRCLQVYNVSSTRHVYRFPAELLKNKLVRREKGDLSNPGRCFYGGDAIAAVCTRHDLNIAFLHTVTLRPKAGVFMHSLLRVEVTSLGFLSRVFIVLFQGCRLVCGGVGRRGEWQGEEAITC